MTNDKMQIGKSDSIDINQPQSDWDNAFSSNQNITFHKNHTQRLKELEQRDRAAVAAVDPNYERNILLGQINSSTDPTLTANLTKELEELDKE